MAPAHTAVAFTPAVLRLHQHHGGFVPVFGLAADVTDGFVNEDGDLLALLLLGLAVNLDARRECNRLAHHGGLAVHPHPALDDPVIRFASRANAQLGHAFVQAHGQRRAVWVGRFRDADGGGFGRILHLLFIF